MIRIESGTDRYTTWDAAYVFDSLSVAERREYEEHLQKCGSCRTAVADLSDVPGLLAKVSASDVYALDAADPVDTVSTRGRSTRMLIGFGAAAAAVLLALGVVIAVRPEVFGLQRATTAPVATGSSMAETSETPISATVGLTGYGWGTRIDMACSYGDWGAQDVPPQPLGMVVVGHDGSHTQVATWLGISGATALPSATTPMQPHEIAAVQLVSADSGKVLLEKQL